MKISYSWLTDYLNLAEPAETVADRLTMVGLEVDDLLHLGNALDGVVVGHVLETRQHPNADRLTLCAVDLGTEEPLQIVCGAPNVATGQKVPVATIGTTLPTPEGEKPFKIKKGKIRGEVSMGMICAEDELGLSEAHSGIMILAPDAEIGQAFCTYLADRGQSREDQVFDISLTPNRPDATSHIGVARDLAAVTQQPLQRPALDLPQPGGETADHIKVTIEDPDGCGRYVALLVKNITLAPSPLWLQQRLEAIGLRPRNNIVDITNYVMYECGQPLHAFDYDMIAGKHIIVRSTEGSSLFTTLDSKERTLPDQTVMICDADRPVAIGGIMGGENSEVTDSTVNVLIESAYFDPARIRRTAKALALQTDASYRFERGVDPAGQVWAAARAAQLMVELAGGTLVPGIVDTHPRPVLPRHLTLRPQRTNHVLGTDLTPEDMQRWLSAIGFAVEAREKTLHCTVPSFRPDVEREIDLIEEIARLYGYDNIPSPASTPTPYAMPQHDVGDTLRQKTLGILSGLGFREIYTNSLLAPDTATQFTDTAADQVVVTLNPVSQEMTTLRPSLLPGVLSVLAHNQRNGQGALRMMEFGHVFAKADKDEKAFVPGYRESEHLLLAMSGEAVVDGWNSKARSVDVFDPKGVVEALLHRLQVTDVDVHPHETPPAYASYQIMLSVREQPLGYIGRVRNTVAEGFDLQAPVYYVVLGWNALVALAKQHIRPQYQAISRFPQVDRDLALVVPGEVPAAALVKTIRTADAKLLRDVRVFDVYSGKGIAEGHKSVAISLRFGTNRTLVDAEVDGRVKRILKRLRAEYGAELRQ